MHSPLISVVVPSFNQGSFIEDCLLSIFNQDFDDYEVLLVDGSSTDETLDIVSRYRHRLAYFISEPDSGQSEAIAKGFERSSGSILTWLNTDDFLCPHSLAHVASFFQNHSDASLLIGKSLMIVEDGSEYIAEPPADFLIPRILCGQACPQPSPFFSASAYKLSRGINIDLHYTMDWDLFAQIALIGKVYTIDSFLSRQSLHSAGKMRKDASKFVPEGTFVFLQLLSSIHGSEAFIKLLTARLGISPSTHIPLLDPHFPLSPKLLLRAVLFFLEKRSHYLISVRKLQSLRLTLSCILRLDIAFFLRQRLYILYLKSIILSFVTRTLKHN